MKSSYLKRNGHERYKQSHGNTDSAATARRKRVLLTLEMQLVNIPKEDLDKPQAVRIKKEIATLNERIKAGHQ